MGKTKSTVEKQATGTTKAVIRKKYVAPEAERQSLYGMGQLTDKSDHLSNVSRVRLLGDSTHLRNSGYFASLRLHQSTTQHSLNGG